MMSAEKLEFWTADKLKQYVRGEQSWANEFNDRVRLAKHLLADANELGLENLVVGEELVPGAYEAPPADPLTTIGPGSRVAVCHWTRSSANEDPGHVCFLDVFVTHRSGDELCGFIPGGLFDSEEKITLELKHVCYVEDET